MYGKEEMVARNKKWLMGREERDIVKLLYVRR